MSRAPREKATVSLPREILADADRQAERLGLDRSSYITLLIAQDVERDERREAPREARSAGRIVRPLSD